MLKVISGTFYNNDISTILNKHGVINRNIRKILSDFHALHVTYLLVENPLSPEKRQLRNQIIEKREELTPLLIGFHQNETQQFEIVIELEQDAKQRAYEKKVEVKQKLVQTYFPDTPIDTIDNRELDRLFLEAQSTDRIRASIETKFTSLISLAEGENNYRISVNFVDNHFVLTAKQGNEEDILLGYSLHEFLRAWNLISRDTIYHSTPSFVIEKEQWDTLNRHLSQLIQWQSDLKEIVTQLVGENAVDQVITLGEKPVSEVIRSEQTPGPNRSMDESFLNRLKAMNPQKPWIMLVQTRLNLEHLPTTTRQKLKTYIESAYRIENMRAHDGQQKTFLIDRPWQSNLSVDQLIAICPHLNKLSYLKYLVENNYGMPNYYEADLTLYGVDSDAKVLAQVNNLELNDTAHILHAPFQRPIENTHSLAQVEHESKDRFLTLLNTYSGVAFTTYNEETTLPSTYKSQLYRGFPTKLYRENQRLINVDCLCDRLLESQSFSRISGRIDGIRETIIQLKSELNTYLDTYASAPNAGRFYGKQLYKEALTYFEEYVAKVYFSDHLKLTDESIEDSFRAIQGCIGPDLTGGCARGFAGRMQSLLLHLVSSAGTEIEDSITEFKHQQATEAFSQLNNSESSMSDDLKNLKVKLGLLSSNARTGEPSSRIQSHFNSKYTPETVYEHLYNFARHKFWELNSAGASEDKKMHLFLKELGFSEASETTVLDQNFRINGNLENRWNYGFFQQKLPNILVDYLLKKGHLFTRTAGQDKARYPQAETRSDWTTSSSIPYGGSQENRTAQAPIVGRRTLETPAATGPSSRRSDQSSSRSSTGSATQTETRLQWTTSSIPDVISRILYGSTSTTPAHNVGLTQPSRRPEDSTPTGPSSRRSSIGSATHTQAHTRFEGTMPTSS